MPQPPPFFQDEQAYRAWIQSMPAIIQIEDGREDLAEEVEGPYFYAPHCLILRVGRDYCALVRVGSREEACFTWYVAETRDTGEEVFATYLLDRRHDPPRMVGAPTIRQAREVIAEFLASGHSGLATVHLWPLTNKHP